jgi:cell division protein FtsA
LARNKPQIVVGLDIGTTKICCVLGETDASGSLTILGSALVPSAGIRRGVVADIAAATAAIRDCKEQAELVSGAHIESVTVGITGEHVTSLNSKGVVAINNATQEIGPEDVERVMESARAIVLPPDREILHTIPRGFIVDGLDGVTRPEGMSGARLEAEAHIVTGTRTFVDNVLKCVYGAGLQVEGGGVVLGPLAAAESVLLPAERDLGVALVDIGGGTTDVAIFTDGAIAHTGVVPIAGEHVTRDIAVGIRLDPVEAERLKVDWGAGFTDLLVEDELVDVTHLGEEHSSQIPRSILTEIIEARMVEIFEKVRDQIRKSGLSGQIPAGVVITGGGSRMHGADKAALEILDMPVRLGMPAERIGLVDAVNHPRFSTAVGLARLAARSVRPPEQSDFPIGPRPGGVLSRLKHWASRG